MIRFSASQRRRNRDDRGQELYLRLLSGADTSADLLFLCNAENCERFGENLEEGEIMKFEVEVWDKESKLPIIFLWGFDSERQDKPRFEGHNKFKVIVRVNDEIVYDEDYIHSSAFALNKEGQK